MKLSAVIGLAIGVVAINAQQTEEYYDPRTGITFQSYTHGTGVSFGVALPENPTNEFIGQLTAPITTGWAGVSFNGGMVNNLLMTAWVYQGEFKQTLRISDSYTSAFVYDSPGPVMTPIFTEGAINSTHWTFTFLCTNCNEWEVPGQDWTNGFDLSGDFGIMGLGISASELPITPANAGSNLRKHSSSTQFGVMLGSARSSDFETFKRLGLAQGSSASSSAAPSSTLAPPTSTLSTVTVPAPQTTTQAPPAPSGLGRGRQCGGWGYFGATVCAAPLRCVPTNQWYSSCA